MQKYQDVVLKTNGSIVPNASVLVQTYPAGTTATIYSDNGVTPTANPTIADGSGRFSFYAADGRYQFVISGTGFTTVTLSDILLEDPSDATAGVFTSLTASGNATVSGNLTANGNTILGDATTDTLNVGVGAIVKDASGNVGIGVSPSARNNTRLQIVDGIGFPATQVASTDPNTLDDYREETYTGTLTGCTTSPTASITYVRVGRLVTVNIASFLFATSNTTDCTITGGPIGMRPIASTKTSTVVKVLDNSVGVAGLITVGTDGVLTLSRLDGAVFTAAGNKGIAGACFSYII